MNIKIQISDELYKKLVASGKRIRGSIALVSPKEGNFSAYVPAAVIIDESAQASVFVDQVTP